MEMGRYILGKDWYEEKRKGKENRISASFLYAAPDDPGSNRRNFLYLKARLFTVSEVLRYGRFMGIMYAIYILFWLFIYSMMQRYVLKRLQKENS